MQAPDSGKNRKWQTEVYWRACAMPKENTSRRVSACQRLKSFVHTVLNTEGRVEEDATGTIAKTGATSQRVRVGLIEPIDHAKDTFKLSREEDKFDIIDASGTPLCSPRKVPLSTQHPISTKNDPVAATSGLQEKPRANKETRGTQTAVQADTMTPMPTSYPADKSHNSRDLWRHAPRYRIQDRDPFLGAGSVYRIGSVSQVVGRGKMREYKEQALGTRDQAEVYPVGSLQETVVIDSLLRQTSPLRRNSPLRRPENSSIKSVSFPGVYDYDSLNV